MGNSQHHCSIASRFVGFAVGCAGIALLGLVGSAWAGPAADPTLPSSDRMAGLGRIVAHAFPGKVDVYIQNEYERARVPAFKSLVINRSQDIEQAVYSVTPFRVFYRIDRGGAVLLGPPQGAEFLFFPILQRAAARRGITGAQVDIANTVALALEAVAKAYQRHSRREFEAAWERLIYAAPDLPAGAEPDASRPVHPPGWDLFQIQQHNIPVPYSQRMQMLMGG